MPHLCKDNPLVALFNIFGGGEGLCNGANYKSEKLSEKLIEFIVLYKNNEMKL
jgi:hypothetical protein